ncbi:hypothetical protein YC2023_086962 [Brassica napus]
MLVPSSLELNILVGNLNSRKSAVPYFQISHFSCWAFWYLPDFMKKICNVQVSMQTDKSSVMTTQPDTNKHESRDSIQTQHDRHKQESRDS